MYLPVDDTLAALIENVALYAVVVVAYTQITGRIHRLPKPVEHALLGLVFGGGAVLGMMVPLHLGSGLIIDGRAIMIGLSAPFGGPWAAAIAGAVGAGYRLWLGGVGAPAGIANPVLASLVGIGFSAVLARRGIRLGHGHFLVLGLLLAGVALVTIAFLPAPLATGILTAAGIPIVVVTTSGCFLLGTLLLQEDRRRAAEAALAESERRFAAIVANAPGVVYQRLRTPDGEISYPYLSPRAGDLLGVDITAAMADGAVMLATIHPDDLEPMLRSHSRSAEDLSPWHEDFRVVKPDGTIRWIRGVSSPHRRADGDVVWDGFLIDITDRKRDEDLVLAAKEVAEAASRTKSEFLANMSHELRTPLNAVIGFADLMRTETLGPLGHHRYVEYAQDIRDSGVHLLSLINDILDLSKVEAGQMALREEVVDLDETIRSCLRMLGQRLLTGRIDLVWTASPDPCRLRGDGQRVKQIVINLLSNAIKYTPAGGRVGLGWKLDEAGRVVLTVEDTGIGIAEADIPKALEAFGQVDNPFNRKTQGTGLGLPLTKRLVEMHGGSLEIRSRVGAGTVVTITLPADRVLDRAA